MLATIIGVFTLIKNAALFVFGYAIGKAVLFCQKTLTTMFFAAI